MEFLFEKTKKIKMIIDEIWKYLNCAKKKIHIYVID